MAGLLAGGAGPAGATVGPPGTGATAAPALTGVVTDRAGTPVSGLGVWAYDDATDALAASGTTGADGRFRLPLGAGTFRLLLWGQNRPYVATWFPGVPKKALATAVTFAATGDLDVGGVAVPLPMTVRGRLADGATGTGIGGLDVWVVAPNGDLRATMKTAADGSYRTDGMWPDPVRVMFRDTTHVRVGPTFWPGVPDGDQAGWLGPVEGEVVADGVLYRTADQPVPPYPAGTGDRVAILGDSLTRQTTGETTAAVGTVARPAVLGLAGLRADEVGPVADRFAATGPDQVVIELGTNDVLAREDPALTAADLDQLLARFPSVGCVTFVTLGTTGGNEPDFDARAEAVDAHLRSLPEADARVQIADWARLLADHRAGGSPGGSWTISDDVHLTPAGEDAWAELLRGAVAACGRPPALLAGTAHLDWDRDGVVGRDDPPAAGATITVTGADLLGVPVSRTTTVAGDGTWSFAALPGGTYDLTQTPLAGAYPAQATTGGLASLPIPDGVRVVVPAGSSTTDVRFTSRRTPHTPAGCPTLAFGAHNATQAAVDLVCPGEPAVRTLGTGQGPVWSPDGDALAWVTTAAPGTGADPGSPGTLHVLHPDASGNPLTETAVAVPGQATSGPRWSPDGRWVAWTAAGAVVAFDRATGASTVTGAGATGAVQWSPDSSRLLAPAAGGLLLVDLQGAPPQPVASGTDEAIWAADGASFVHRDAAGALHRTAADGSADAVLVTAPVTVWAWTGRDRIAYSRPGGAIRSVLPDGTADVGVASAMPGTGLHWSPAGGDLLVDADPPVVADGNGGGVYPLPTTAATGPAAFSPDGASVAWTEGLAGGGVALRRATTHGGAAQTVAVLADPDLAPAPDGGAPRWNHAGDAIAFAFTPTGGGAGGVAVARLSGADPVRWDGRSLDGPGWSPDDGLLAVTTAPTPDRLVALEPGSGAEQVLADAGADAAATGGDPLALTAAAFRPDGVLAGDLAVAAAFTAPTVAVPGVATLDVTVRNDGDCGGLPTVVTLDLPDGVQIVGGPSTPAVPALAPGTATTLTVALSIDQHQPTRGSFDVGVRLGPHGADPDPADDAATATAVTGPAGTRFHPVAATRLFDSRSGDGIEPWQPVGPGSAAGQVARVPVTGRAGIPATATALVFNLTATGASAASYLTAFPSGRPVPDAANVLFQRGQTVGNLVVVPLAIDPADGELAVSVFNQQGTVDVIGDLVGWFEPPAGGGDAFTPVAPARVVDSRTGLGFSGPLGSGGSAVVDGADLATVLGNLPADVDALVLNVTVTGGTAGSYLEVTEAGSTAPATASLLFAPGQTVSNLVTVKVRATDQAFRITNQTGQVHVVADLVGLYRTGSGALFHAVEPVRALDSRTTLGGWGGFPLGENGNRTLALRTGPAALPGDAVAVAGNLTATGGTKATYVTASPTPGPVPAPTASVLVSPGATIPNALLAPLGASARLDLFNQHGNQHVVLDVSGWFAPT